MTEAITTVKTGQVTYAVRDTVVGDFQIKPDDILGILEGKIESVDSSVEESVFNIVDKMIDDETSVITLFYGEGVAKEDAEKARIAAESGYIPSDAE